MAGGRPTKLTPALIEIMGEVVENSLYWTDEELLMDLNEKLVKAGYETINETTFKDYKAGRQQADNPLLDQFSSLIKKALAKEKRLLLDAVRSGEGNWQSRSWILERKFNEWNLRRIGETTHKGSMTIERLLEEAEAEED